MPGLSKGLAQPGFFMGAFDQRALKSKGPDREAKEALNNGVYRAFTGSGRR
jgi:hypothetical protein